MILALPTTEIGYSCRVHMDVIDDCQNYTPVLDDDYDDLVIRLIDCNLSEQGKIVLTREAIQYIVKEYSKYA